MRLLLITPRFYDLEKYMVSVLESNNHSVYWIENKIIPFDYHPVSARWKTLRKIYFYIFRPERTFVRKALLSIDDLKFDILFAINGFVICPYLIRKLKKKNPGIKTIMYLWDSFSMYSWIDRIELFDKVFTFDKEDAKKFNLRFIPNFYIPLDDKLIYPAVVHLFFVGKFSPERLRFLDAILVDNQNEQLKTFIRLIPVYKSILHNWFIYKILKKIGAESSWINDYILNYEASESMIDRDYIEMEKVPYFDTQQAFNKANVIIDIPFRDQTGLSHRMVAALVKGKKIITTNANIAYEPFYNKAQIKIIDCEKPSIDLAWARENKIFKPVHELLDVRFETWLNAILFS
jgi:hypothetical protein